MKIADFLKLDYPIHLSPITDEAGMYWRAMFPDLPGCEAFGDTPEEALSKATGSKIAWIESAYEDGDQMPFPSSARSGKFLLRLSPDLHETLAGQATERGMSLNAHVAYLLAKRTTEEDTLNIMSQIKESIQAIKANVDLPHRIPHFHCEYSFSKGFGYSDLFQPIPRSGAYSSHSTPRKKEELSTRAHK